MKKQLTPKREELACLPTERLSQMLNQELDKAQKDDALVLALLQILEDRLEERPICDSGDAWQTFQDRYHTPITPEPRACKKLSLRWISGLAAAIAVFFLVAFGIPKATGHDNFIEMVVSWTDDFFYLSHPDRPPVQNEYAFKTDNPGLQQVYDTVIEMGITDPVVPMWIPDGYELVEIKDINICGGNKLVALFKNGSSRIIMHFEATGDPEDSNCPKDDSDAEIIELGGVTVSVLFNEGYTVALWSMNNIECVVMTTEDKETTIRIMKSIFVEDNV